ncbi:MAG: ATP-sensitive inward rectifier potassium channel 10 [Leptolyngbyaceae cyanobacterium MAG.088]|nr:ATP-sensitive inward rectifier potassium channel 10 [Leptolyngbyaceae cyanobacterium MAG.088]
MLKPKLRHASRRFLLYREQRYPNIERIGVTHSYWGDLYHILLTIAWPAFIMLVSGCYLLANALFAIAYSLDADAIANIRDGHWQDLFFFSVQTMASIGYGAMHPTSDYTHSLVVIESIFGLFFVAVTTGLVFARFSLPTARILYSRVAVVAPFNSVPTLMFRTANERRNYILEAQLWVTLVRDEVTEEGEHIRRFHDIPLVRSHTPVFSLTWTAMHRLTRDSALYGETPETLRQNRAEIIVTLTGLDETLSQTIHARHSFSAHDIYWNHKFVDIISTNAQGRSVVDYNHFHSIEPLEQTMTHRYDKEQFTSWTSN